MLFFDERHKVEERQCECKSECDSLKYRLHAEREERRKFLLLNKIYPVDNQIEWVCLCSD